MNSKQKGNRGELEFAHYLTSYGFPARRGQQFSGSPESPDVICESLPFHWEVKRTEKGNLYKWWEQAIRDSDHQEIPVVAHRKNGKQWVAILAVEDLLHIMEKLKSQ